MWLVAATCVCIVLWQAVISFRRGRKAGLELGMTSEKMKESIKAATITALGPALSVGTGFWR